MTMEQYTQRARDRTGPGLVRLPIPEATNFELKGKFINMHKETPFYRKDKEDAYQDIDEVLEITNYFDIVGVNKDALMLRILPITFKDAATRWLKSLPAGTIIT